MTSPHLNLSPPQALEFYETPRTFTRFLFSELRALGHSIAGVVCEPTAGAGAILEGSASLGLTPPWSVDRWICNDLDPSWRNEYQEDATDEAFWRTVGIGGRGIDWTVGNPPFTAAVDIITHALRYSRVGVAMHLRATIHEVLKTGPQRTWMLEHPPSGILWLPRFGYQRSTRTGKWSTDSVCACWVVWLKDVRAGQFIRYAPPWVLDELKAETPVYRARMDELMERRAA